MSNHPSNREQNRVIQQTEKQRNPYLCRPEDFKVTSAADAARATVPHHGQHGRNEQERALLFREQDADGKSPLTGRGQKLNPRTKLGRILN